MTCKLFEQEIRWHCKRNWCLVINYTVTFLNSFYHHKHSCDLFSWVTTQKSFLHWLAYIFIILKTCSFTDCLMFVFIVIPKIAFLWGDIYMTIECYAWVGGLNFGFVVTRIPWGNNEFSTPGRRSISEKLTACFLFIEFYREIRKISMKPWRIEVDKLMSSIEINLPTMKENPKYVWFSTLTQDNVMRH